LPLEDAPRKFTKQVHLRLHTAHVTPAQLGGAPVESVERLFIAIEQALTAIGFHDPQQPKHSMARLRSLLARAGPSSGEVELLLGICAAIVEPKRLRAGSKKSQSSPLSRSRERGRG